MDHALRLTDFILRSSCPFFALHSLRTIWSNGLEKYDFVFIGLNSYLQV